jgi:hypothetical protein
MCRFEKQLWKPFQYFDFDTLPRAENCLFTMIFYPQSDFYVNNIYDNFQSQKRYTKKIFKIYQHV